MDDRKKLIQTIKTYKGMLDKQNKIIDAMAEMLVVPADEKVRQLFTPEIIKIKKQKVREYFEKKIK